MISGFPGSKGEEGRQFKQKEQHLQIDGDVKSLAMFSDQRMFIVAKK